MLTTTLILAFAPSQTAGANFVRDIERQRAALVAEFRRPGFWERPVPEIRVFCDAAAVLRPPELLPDLVEHIALYDQEKRWPYSNRQPMADYRPVYRALLGYGREAVPTVLDHMARHDLRNLPPNEDLFRNGVHRTRREAAHLRERWLWDLAAGLWPERSFATGQFDFARGVIAREVSRREGAEREALLHLLETRFPPAKP